MPRKRSERSYGYASGNASERKTRPTKRPAGDHVLAMYVCVCVKARVEKLRRYVGRRVGAMLIPVGHAASSRSDGQSRLTESLHKRERKTTKLKHNCTGLVLEWGRWM